MSGNLWGVGESSEQNQVPACVGPYPRVGGQVTLTDDFLMITELVGEEAANT